LYRTGYFDDYFFTLTDYKRVDKIGHWLRVIASMSASNYQWKTRIAVFAANGHSCHIQHIQYVGKELLVR